MKFENKVFNINFEKEAFILVKNQEQYDEFLSFLKAYPKLYKSFVSYKMGRYKYSKIYNKIVLRPPFYISRTCESIGNLLSFKKQIFNVCDLYNMKSYFKKLEDEV